MENGGRSGGGRGKGKKGKKKAVNSHIGGKNGNANVQGHAVGSKPVISTPHYAREDDFKNTRGAKDPTLTKRKRLKKTTEAMDIMFRKQVETETETLTASGQAHEELRTTFASTAATVKSHVMSLTGKKKKKKKKRKRNVVLNALNGTSDSGRVTTTGSLKEGPPLDENKSPLSITQSMKTKGVVLSPSPSTAIVTNQKMVGATSPKRKIAQRQPQHAQKSDLVTTAATASPRKMAKEMKTKAVGLSAGSVSMLQKDKSEVIMNKLKPKTKVQQATDKANFAKGTLMLQQVLQADAAITAKSQDEATLCTNVTTVDTNSSPSAAALDDEFAPIRPAPDASTRDPAISSKPSRTPSAAASLSSVREKSVLQEPIPGKATSHLTDITKTSPASVANAFLPQLATARLVSPPPAKSKVIGGHKRRRSIDQADPVQPPTKRSAALSKDDVSQSQPNMPNETQSSTGGEFTAVDHSPNLPRHHVTSQPATAQDTHECLIKVVGGQATPTVEATRSQSQSASEKYYQTEPVEIRRTTAQPTQLLASVSSIEPAPEPNTTSVKAQPALGNDTQPSAKQVEPAVKAKCAISAAAPSKLKGFGPRSIAAKTQKVDIIMDSRKSVQEMMDIDLETSSHGDSRLIQPAQSMLSLPPRPRNAWGASFGMVLPAHGALSVPRTLSTTPLSSWFLSRGYANFVKQVHFSDDDDASSSEDDVPLTRRPLSNSNGADKVPLKSRASTAKKNAFLESLTTQSYWRSWYGTVDMHNLLDPPLVYVPDRLRTHEVTPLSLPAPRTESEWNTSAKKNTDLERLEADIRQEKQRGSVFSKQLLMMLQGKTVSGKSLDEEYRLLLHQ